MGRTLKTLNYFHFYPVCGPDARNSPLTFFEFYFDNLKKYQTFDIFDTLKTIEDYLQEFFSQKVGNSEDLKLKNAS